LLVTHTITIGERRELLPVECREPCDELGDTRLPHACRSGSRVDECANLLFEEPAQFRGRRYWDGGLAGYANPILAAVIEAMANFPQRRRRHPVLSIGTGIVTQASTDAAPSPRSERRRRARDSLPH
jgi:hypothetical protein